MGHLNWSEYSFHGDSSYDCCMTPAMRCTSDSFRLPNKAILIRFPEALTASLSRLGYGVDENSFSACSSFQCAGINNKDIKANIT